MLASSLLAAAPGCAGGQAPEARVQLPPPDTVGASTLEAALRARRSAREFSDAPLARREVAQLLWAAQGVTHARGFRTAPSAGALYPLELFVVVGRVEGLGAGVYRYRPDEHELSCAGAEDRRAALAEAALGQEWVAEAPVSIVIAAVPERTTRRYGDRGHRYVHMEVGHAAQNVYLQAAALGLGAVFVGAFEDRRVARVLDLPAGTVPLGILSAGHPGGSGGSP